MQKKLSLQVYSEIGKLKGVILHPPGPEVENMTPDNAERALYSDILNLSVATEEYHQFENVLKKVTEVYYVKDLLCDILEDSNVKMELIEQVCKSDNVPELRNNLSELSAKQLATVLIEGFTLPLNLLSNFLSDERYALQPLHNFFFTRDASLCVWNNAVVSRMATKVRQRETLIMNAIFAHSFNASIINPAKQLGMLSNISYEGGDILVISDEIILIGIGKRTTPKGVDFIVEQFAAKNNGKFKVIVQELPESPESFIHMDMAFTMLSREHCMVYAPLIMEHNKFQTIAISVEGGKVIHIKKEENILKAFENCKLHLHPILCGGSTDRWVQEREQWHSGTNFFTIEPGKVIGYARNTNTIEELRKHGFEVIKANDFIANNKSLEDYGNCVITLEGSELARGGGGARCMSMPFYRDSI